MSETIEIFIVEECPSQAEQLKHILEQHGHTVSVQHNAIQALASIRQHKPQIVISAVNLPGMDGYALCREIKADDNLKDIPVILLTSLSDTKDVIRGLECGADNFVTKPYDEKLLISRIEYIVLNRALRLGSGTQTGLEIIFDGEKYSITPERQQMVDLLISTYEVAVQKNLELRIVEQELRALNERLKVEVKDQAEDLIEEVAERKLAEQALIESEERLHQSQKLEAVGRLAGGIAHDFNNLLTAIIGYSQLIQFRLKKTDPMRHDISEIYKAGQRAAGLISQLLAFSRKQILQPKILDLNAIVANISNMLSRLIGEDIKFGITLDPGLKRVKVDPGQIDQVLTNLVVNARDAMPGGGSLSIETANIYLNEEYAGHHIEVLPGHYIRLVVSDSGCGMDNKTLGKIFEPFFTTKEQGKGTGLGLATVYGIVKQSGGHIWVYSEPDKGTTFKVYFPQVEEEPSLLKAPVQSEVFPAGTETVLLAEDNLQVKEFACRVLRELGYKVLEASNGHEAQLVAQQTAGVIDILLTDVVMPQIGGKTLSEKLKLERPEMKVLFVSGYTADSIIHHGVLDEGVCFLHKPFTGRDLAQKVREVLDYKELCV